MPRKKRVVIDRESFLSGWDEIEAYTGLSRKVLRPEIKAGRLKATRIGKRWVTGKSDCDAWLQTRLR